MARGIRLAEEELSDTLDIVYSMMVDEAMSALHDRLRPDARRAVDNWLAGGAVSQYDRDTWGKLPEHQEGLRAAMAYGAGGGIE